MHRILGLGWDEWASIIVIISTIFGAFSYTVKSMLKRYVKEPMDGIRDDLQKSHKMQQKNIDALEKREAQQDKLLDQHDKMLLKHDLKINNLEEKYK